ncbi:hypothetical protein WEI85_21895 [Actinomycetes bacterium KLBMP 9797]
MRATWWVRLGAVAAAGLMIIGPASPAWADEIDINPGNVPATAAEFSTHDCDPNFGGGPHPGADVWVFVLPGKDGGDFVSVTADFGAGGTKTIPDDGGAIVTDKGTSKAWISTPAGWTLESATAEITGTATKFNLTHTCPSTGTPEPTDEPEPEPSGESEPEPTFRPSGAPETGGGGGQPTGGIALGVGAVALAGLAGLGLTLTRRRRRGA